MAKLRHPYATSDLLVGCVSYLSASELRQTLSSVTSSTTSRHQSSNEIEVSGCDHKFGDEVNFYTDKCICLLNMLGLL